MLLDVSQIFETPWPALTVALIALAVVVIIRQTWPERSRWWQLLIPLIIAAAGLGLEHFIETDYEKIESVIEAGRQVVISRDIGRLASIISTDYSDSRHYSKDALLLFCRDLLSQPFVERIKRQQELVNISGQKAQAEISLRLHLHPQNPYAQGGTLMYVKMKLRLTKTAYGNWLISGSDIISINNQPFGWGSV
ncbi:MAG: hypothetical protein DRP65_06360 [Planctomycetota bacterium]|nr:MAG: hypothetical protein DRP65_06360 [Planctomycetota bacterium]